MSDWTDERVEELKRLWKAGLSASEVAQKLGGVSRNAVIGKICRLGCARGRVFPTPVWTPDKIDRLIALVLAEAPQVQIAMDLELSVAAVNTKIHGLRSTGRLPKLPKKSGAYYRNLKPPKPRQEPRSFIIAGNGAVNEKPSPRAPRVPAKVRAFTPLPGSDPVALMGLRSSSCRWPVDVPNAVEQHFCGELALGRYCAAHEKLSIGKGTVSEREAHKALEKAA